MTSIPPVVFVHGNPETAKVWEPLSAAVRAVRSADQVRLSPPGFGARLPVAFEPSPEAYRMWLAAELERIGRPVDLVGHDWGGAHVLAVAMSRPDLVRTWATDAVGLFHPDYEWHPLAQIWQTPGAGEKWVADRIAAPDEEVAALYVSLGMEATIAASLAPAFDADMGRCVVQLYRQARQPAMAEIGRNLSAARARRGLALLAQDDENMGSVAQRRAAAETAGADIAMLPGARHWWMTSSDQSLAVGALNRLWEEADRVFGGSAAGRRPSKATAPRGGDDLKPRHHSAGLPVPTNWIRCGDLSEGQ